MSPTLRRWSWRALVVAGCLVVAMFVCRRTYVHRPGLTVRVLDPAGAPLPDATVVVYGWSYPYRRLDATFAATTGSDGTAGFREQRRTETIAPLCMHGIPQHHHSVCVSAPGRGAERIELRGERALTVRLAPAAPGATVEDCWSFGNQRIDPRAAQR